MSDLRTRIAGVLVRRLTDDSPTWDESLRLADALIWELGLERENRYVTEWAIRNG